MTDRQIDYNGEGDDMGFRCMRFNSQRNRGEEPCSPHSAVQSAYDLKKNLDKNRMTRIVE
jgi:hypothetical protein